MFPAFEFDPVFTLNFHTNLPYAPCTFPKVPVPLSLQETRTCNSIPLVSIDNLFIQCHIATNSVTQSTMNSSIQNDAQLEQTADKSAQCLTAFDNSLPKSTKISKQSKAYAPIDPNIAALPKAHTSELYAKRQQRRADRAQPTLPTTSDYMPKTLSDSTSTKLAAKKEARAQYTKRKPNASHNIPPLLDLTVKMPEILAAGRLVEYSRTHKCIHGRCFNVLFMDEDMHFIVPVCDHDREKIGDKIPGYACQNCGRKSVHSVTRLQNSDTIYHCTRCRVTDYTNTLGDDRIHNRFPIKDNEDTLYHDDAEPIKFEDLNISYTKKRLPKITIADLADDGFKPNTHTPSIPKVWGPANVYTAHVTKPEPSLESLFTPIDLYVTGAKTVQAHAQGGVVSSMVKTVQTGLTSVIDTIVKTIRDYRLSNFLFEKASDFCNLLMRPFKWLRKYIILSWEFLKEEPLTSAAILSELEFLLSSDSFMSSARHLLALHTIYKLLKKSAAYKAVLIKLAHKIAKSDTNKTYSDDELIEIAEQEATVNLGFFSKLFAYFMPAAQAGDDTSHFSTFTKAFCSLIPSVNFKKTFGKVADLAGDFNKIFSLGKNLGTIATLFFSFLPVFLQKLLGAADPDLSFSKELVTPGNPIHSCATASTIALLNNDPKSCSAAEFETYRQNALISLTDCKNYLSTQYTTLTPKIQKTLENWHTMASSPFCADRRDFEPLVLTISGDAGVGKSTVWPAIASAFVDGTIKQIKECTYTRNTDSDFWDGYNNDQHEITLYDDFGQVRTEKDFSELIAIVSSSQYLPAFASLNSSKIGVKGSMFKSRLIVLLSNTTNFKPVTLNSNEALNRRTGFHIVMHIDKKKPKSPRFTHATFTIHSIDGKLQNEIGLTDNAHYSLGQIQTLFHTYALKKTERTEELEEDLEDLCFKPSEQDNFQSSHYNPKISIKKDVSTTSKSAGKSADNQIPRVETIKYKPIKTKSKNKISEFNEPSSDAFEQWKKDNETYISEAEAGFESPKYRALFEQVSQGFVALGTAACMGTIFSHVAQATYSVFSGSDNTLKTLSYLAGFIATTLGGYLLLKKLYVTAKPESGETNTLVSNRPHIVSQSAQDETLHTIVRRNLIKLRYTIENVHHNNALFVQGNTIITNEHFFFPTEVSDSKYIPTDTVVQILDPLIPQKIYMDFKFNPKNMVKIISKNEKDLVLYQLPTSIPARPTLVHHFSPGNVELTKKEVLFFQLTYPNIDVILHHTEVVDDLITTEYEVSPGGVVRTTKQHDTFLYKFKSSKGDCGSPVVVLHHDGWKISGLHAAGNSILGGQAFGIMVTRSQLEQTLVELEIRNGRKTVQQSAEFPYESISPVKAISQTGTFTTNSANY